MATNDSDAAPPSSVWVHLYYKGKDQPVGVAIKITPIPEDMHDLKTAVLATIPSKLAADVDIMDLIVYAAGTSVPITVDTFLSILERH
jgi:hypothetical protein